MVSSSWATQTKKNDTLLVSCEVKQNITKPYVGHHTLEKQEKVNCLLPPGSGSLMIMMAKSTELTRAIPLSRMAITF